MKKITKVLTAIMVISVGASGSAAMAQTGPGGSQGFQGHDMINTGAPIGSTTAGDTRLGGSRQERIDALIYQDRQAIKELKKQLKTAETPEDRAAIKGQIEALQQDIINIQQQG